MVLVNLAQAETARGASPETTGALLDEALACVMRTGEPRNGLFVAYAWAAHARDRGDLEGARTAFSRAHRRADQRGYAWYVATTGLGSVSVLLELGEFDEAARQLDETTERIGALASATLEGVALRYRGVLAHLEGRLEDASEASQAAAAVLAEAGHSV